MIEEILGQVRLRIAFSGKKCNKKINTVDMFKKYLYEGYYDIYFTLITVQMPSMKKEDLKIVKPMQQYEKRNFSL